MAPFHFDPTSPVSLVRWGVGLVWVVFGLGFKLLDAVPRHRRIVGRILGERHAGALTRLIGLAECALGVWMWSGRWTLACVAVQAVAIVTMNALEIARARDLLLSPRWMVVANTALLGAAMFVAFGPR
jgi:hypothetical protein